MDFITRGRTNNTGYVLHAVSFLESGDLKQKAGGRVYALINFKKGFGSIRINNENVMVTAPAVYCVNERELPELMTGGNLEYELLYFDPSIININLTYEIINESRFEYSDELWFLIPYTTRTDRYKGIINVNHLASKYISEKLLSLNRQLYGQPDFFWPCRSRSYLLELFTAVNRMYESDECPGGVVAERHDEEIGRVIDYLRMNYQNKIIISDITRRFSTNKTSLNNKFKEATGLSPIEYLTHVRIQLACAMLRDTYIPVSEIMNRTGFIDDAHFTRIFSKHTHFTPAAYRKQYNWMY